MGQQNKLLMSLPGISMIEHTITQLTKITLRELIVVTGFESEKIASALSNHGASIKIVNNPEYALGQTSSIRIGIRNLEQDIHAVMICLSDMPLLTAEHYRQLIARYRQLWSPGVPLIIRPQCGGKPGHPVIMDQAFIPEIVSCNESNGPRSVITQNRSSFRPWTNCDQAYYTDIDTPEDLELLRIKIKQ